LVRDQKTDIDVVDLEHAKADDLIFDPTAIISPIRSPQTLLKKKKKSTSLTALW